MQGCFFIYSEMLFIIFKKCCIIKTINRGKCHHLYNDAKTKTN